MRTPEPAPVPSQPSNEAREAAANHMQAMLGLTANGQQHLAAEYQHMIGKLVEQMAKNQQRGKEVECLSVTTKPEAAPVSSGSASPSADVPATLNKPRRKGTPVKRPSDTSSPAGTPAKVPHLAVGGSDALVTRAIVTQSAQSPPQSTTVHIPTVKISSGERDFQQTCRTGSPGETLIKTVDDKAKRECAPLDLTAPVAGEEVTPIPQKNTIEIPKSEAQLQEQSESTCSMEITDDETSSNTVPNKVNSNNNNVKDANTCQAKVQILVLNGKEYEIVPLGEGRWMSRSDYELMEGLKMVSGVNEEKKQNDGNTAPPAKDEAPPSSGLLSRRSTSPTDVNKAAVSSSPGLQVNPIANGALDLSNGSSEDTDPPGVAVCEDLEPGEISRGILQQAHQLIASGGAGTVTALLDPETRKSLPMLQQLLKPPLS